MSEPVDVGQKQLQERADKISALGYYPSDGNDLGFELEPTDSEGAPAKSASRADWDEYARSQGVDPDAFGSKEELQAHFGVS